MLTQLLIGSLAICVTVAVQSLLMALAFVASQKTRHWLNGGSHVYRMTISIVLVTMGMLGGLTVAVWLWSGVLIGIGLFETLEEAVYFSIVSFTTLGFGDVILGKPWRLLSGLIATNGMMLFGLTTAFLFEILAQLRITQEPD